MKKKHEPTLFSAGEIGRPREVYLFHCRKTAAIYVSPPRQLHAHDPLPPRQAYPPPGLTGQEAIDLEDGGVSQGEGLQAGVLGGEG